MERDVQYCTTEDGVRIAYCVTGEGPPLLACPYFIESFGLDHMWPPYEQFMVALGQHARLIRFDTRGLGLSDHNVTDFSLEALIRDIDAVVGAAGVDAIDVWAAMGSVMRAIGYVVQRPDRVRNLVLYEAYGSGTDVWRGDRVKSMAALARSDWRTAAHAMAGSLHGPISLASAVYMVGEWNRKSATGEGCADFIEAQPATSVADLLHRVATPTLILHHRGDTFIPMSAAQNVAAQTAGSRMRILDGGPFFWATEDMARDTAEAVDRFLHAGDDRTGTAQSASPFRTVLFTDLVGHTEMMQRLGDAKGRDVLREHERITRDTLKQHGGVELKTDGDSFMVSFASVTAAMDCAVALQRAFAVHNETSTEPIAVRMGLNAGEPIEEDGDLFGSSVILAARIAAEAEAGEILIAEPVRHLLSGKNFVYADRGETVLKGFEDAVRLYEVRWRQ
jgi:class 3 adenylate cyclase